jgi:hypothetical protein
MAMSHLKERKSWNLQIHWQTALLLHKQALLAVKHNRCIYCCVKSNKNTVLELSVLLGHCPTFRHTLVVSSSIVECPLLKLVRSSVYCIYTKTSGHKTILSVTQYILWTGLL